MFLKVLKLILFIFSFYCVLFSCKKKNAVAEDLGVEVKAIWQNEQSLGIDISIASGLHIYLDQGIHKNLIPIAFAWQDFIKAKEMIKIPTLLKSPRGEYDKKAEGTVLRSNGYFLFQSKELSKIKGKELRVRVQICDEEQGICYRPQWLSISI